MPDTTSIPVIILFGPTASGKTAVLEELFAAPGPAFPAEIISADSMQVYRGMDIGTAKASAGLMSRLPHHLIDIRDPREQFHAGDFVHLADEACLDITNRGKLPVISGGTGFYIKNFVLGLPETPPSDPGIREELLAERERSGIEPLAKELEACDPVSFARIHINDEYRILRALEVFRSSGKPLSGYAQTGSNRVNRPDYRFLTLGLRSSRDDLYRRINRRCSLMFQEGLPGEVAGLYAAGYGPGDPGLKAIGYKEFFIQNGDKTFRLTEDLAGVEELIARNSRRYAKRQILFFSSLPDVVWVDAGRGAGKKIREILEAFLNQG